MTKKKQTGPRVLLLDCETAPILGYVWSLWEQNVALNQIHRDWCVLSWSAKWLNDPPSKIMYADQRYADDIEDDKKLLKGVWKLLDEADVVITHNGKRFDIPKLNARFVQHGFQPPSTFKQIDTLALAKKHFAFTSNRLEYLTDKLNKTHKKSKHGKFDGFSLWRECLAGNQAAWKEMEKYNKADVLALEELYHRLIPWDAAGVNFSWYTDGEGHVCKCGSTQFQKRGFAYTAVGKFQCYRCSNCGAETRDRTNLFSKEKRASLQVGTTR